MQAESRERGIPFSGPMVRAIHNTKPDVWPAEPIDPARPFKWQTRRPVNAQPGPYLGYMMARSQRYAIQCGEDYPDDDSDRVACPYGAPSTRLYVKEGLRPSGSRIVVYEEDGCPAWRDGESVTWPWKVSALAARYMPRWAARITLEITDVRVQRVQEISEEDALAEGIGVFDFPVPPDPPGQFQRMYGTSAYFPKTETTAAKAFRRLWDSTYAKQGYGWSANPWVWAISFMVVSSPKGSY